jgi:hypothetical protein
MQQIITGPFGRLAFYDPEAVMDTQFPAFNPPSCEFARGEVFQAANFSHAPNVIPLPRQFRRNAAMAMFGRPTKREQ